MVLTKLIDEQKRKKRPHQTVLTMSALKPTATAVISKRSEDHNDDSVDESNNGSSTNTGAKPGEDSLARKESHNVFRLRVLVILLLILTAAVVSYVVYRLTTHGEEEEFIARYEGVADTVISCKSIAYCIPQC